MIQMLSGSHLPDPCVCVCVCMRAKLGTNTETLTTCKYVHTHTHKHKEDGSRGDAMMERMLLSKFETDDVAVMSPSVFRQEADLLRKEYTKVQAGRRGMPNIEKATDAEIGGMSCARPAGSRRRILECPTSQKQLMLRYPGTCATN